MILSPWRRRFVLVLALCTGAALMHAADGNGPRPMRPYCPTEDACHVDYTPGQWHVVEDSTTSTIPVRVSP